MIEFVGSTVFPIIIWFGLIWAIAAWSTNTFGALKSLVFLPIVVGCFAIFSAEMLTIFDLFTIGSMQIIAFGLALLILMQIKAVFSGSKKLALYFAKLIGLAWQRGKFIDTLLCRLSFILVMISLTIALFVAVIYPPNNLDSLAYHLPRIMNWFQNGNVNFFATNNNHQLDIPPLAEYFSAFAYGITGNDVLLNTVQWVALILSLCILSACAWIISKSKIVLSITLVLAASSQTALIEATTTQVDLISSVWVFVGLLQFVMFKKQMSGFRESLFVFSSLIFLAAATKPTSLLFLSVIALLFVFQLLIADSPKGINKFIHLLLFGFAILTAFIAGMLPQGIRNLNWFGAPLGSHTNLVNEKFGPLETIAGFVRIILNNVGLPLENLTKVPIQKVTQAMGIDWTSSSNVLADHFALITSAMGGTEDQARSPFQLFAGLVGAIIILALRKKYSAISVSFAIAFLGFLLVQATVLKWNLWTNRFLIPVYFTGALLFALSVKPLITDKFRSRKFFSQLVGVLLLAASLFGFFAVSQQPVRSFEYIIQSKSIPERNQSYFGYNISLVETYSSLAAKINALPKGRMVRIYANQDDPTYILWALANPKMDYRFEVVKPGGKVGAEIPDYIFCLTKCQQP